MKFKSEKGFTGVDITVALIVILLLMSLISILFFNITKSSKSIDRRSEATHIATSVIEAVKSLNYDDVKVTNNETQITQQGKEIQYTSASSVTVSLGQIDKIEDGYTCIIKIENYTPSSANTEITNKEKELNDLVKVVTVRVEYKLANEVKNVELTTTIVKRK